MTQADLVLRLIEMLLSEKDKNVNQSNAEETKLEKKLKCHYIIKKRKLLQNFLFLYKKSMCSYSTHTGKQYTQSDLKYIA